MTGLINELESSPVPSETEQRPPVQRSEASAVHLDILPMVAGADDENQEPASPRAGGGGEAVAVQLSVVPEAVSTCRPYGFAFVDRKTDSCCNFLNYWVFRWQCSTKACAHTSKKVQLSAQVTVCIHAAESADDRHLHLILTVACHLQSLRSPLEDSASVRLGRAADLERITAVPKEEQEEESNAQPTPGKDLGAHADIFLFANCIECCNALTPAPPRLGLKLLQSAMRHLA